MKFFTEKYIVDAQTVLPGLSWRGKRSGDEANCSSYYPRLRSLKSLQLDMSCYKVPGESRIRHHTSSFCQLHRACTVPCPLHT